MKRILIPFLLTLVSALPAATGPEYSIQAIRYASAEDEVAGLVMGGPKGEKINIAMIIWLIRGGGHNILLDSGYHRETFLKYFPSTEYIRPDEAVKLAGVQPEEITDIVISHSHWDHIGGIDLFPKAVVCGFRRKSIGITRERRGSLAGTMAGLIRKTFRRWSS